LITSINLDWTKLNKYYTLTDKNTIFYVAVTLHPGMKLEYFEVGVFDEDLVHYRDVAHFREKCI